MQKKSILLIASALFLIIFNSVCYGAVYAPADEMSGQPTWIDSGATEPYEIYVNIYDSAGNRGNIRRIYFKIECDNDSREFSSGYDDSRNLVMVYDVKGNYSFVFTQDQAYLTDNDGEIIEAITGPGGAAGYKVKLQFKINDTWMLAINPSIGDHVNYGISFAVMGTGDDFAGVYESDRSDCMFDNDGSFAPKDKTRSLWMWDQNDNLLDTIITTPDLTKRAEFFSFLSAPYGDTEKNIDTIYLNVSLKSLELIRPPYTEADNEGLALLRSFIADAHSKGFKVEALFGETSIAIYSDGGIGYLDWVYEYNKLARENEQYDGIHFDVEPHIIDNESVQVLDKRDESRYLDWDNESDKVYIWQEYIKSMRLFASEVQTHNSQETKNSLFGASIHCNYDEWGLPVVAPDPSGTLGNEQVQKISGLDYVATMNYLTLNPSPNASRDEIIFAEEFNTDHGADKFVIVGYETKDLESDGESFWNLGNDELEKCITRTDRRYGNSAIDEANYDSYKGVAIHEYEYDHGAGHISGYKHFPVTANKAPVAFVLDPSNDGIAIADPYSASYSIQYAVYDYDTTTLTVNAYIMRNGIQIGDAINPTPVIHNVTPSTPLASGTISCSFNTTDHPKGGGYKIKLVVTDTGGLTGVDESNFDFHLGTGLLIHYTFEDDASGTPLENRSDYAGTGVYDGEIVGNVTHVTDTPDGITGPIAKGTGAYEFTGGYIGLPWGVNPTAGLTRFTITMWMRTDDLYDDDNNNGQWDEGEDVRNYKLAAVARWDGTYSFASGWNVGTHYPEFWDGDNSDGSYSIRIQAGWERDSGFPFEESEWNFVAVTYDGNRLMEYVNGTPQGHVIQEKETPVSGQPIGDAPGRRLGIGAWPWGYQWL